MSYSESMPPFMPSQSQSDFQVGSDAIGVWPQFPMNNNGQHEQNSAFEQHEPPFKRSRSSDENGNRSTNGRMPPPTDLPVNSGNTNIFFKTRMCVKFRSNACRNGENCNFAHGIHDLRQPPPNWQELSNAGARSGEDDRSGRGNWNDEHRIIHTMKICKKYWYGEECPYGDRCNFLHERPSTFRDDNGRFRESSAISIGTTEQVMGQGSSRHGGPEVNRVTSSTESDAFRPVAKTVYWKTKLCTKWEITGQCPFGDKCHFAHGQSELQSPGGRPESETGNVIPVVTKPTTAVFANGAAPNKFTNVPSSTEERQEKKCLLKWKQPKKLNKIYADWLDDIPLVANLTNQVESEV